MLPAAHRLRRSVDFERTVRRGTRAGRPTIVVHFYMDFASSLPPRVGLVVSKAVGNAVCRNLVKRRIRALMAEQITDIPDGALVVVRALPLAAKVSYRDLVADCATSVRRAIVKAQQHSVGAPQVQKAPSVRKVPTPPGITA